MRIKLIAFGKLRNEYRKIADQFIKQIQPWNKLEEIELKPMPVPGKSQSVRQQIQKKEAEILLEKLRDHLSPRGRFYLLDEGGKAMPTQGWSDFFVESENDAIPEVALIVGSSIGFDPIVRQAAAGSFSFGPQTLAHDLARIVLLEQIYRALSVSRGHPYHNEGS